MRSSEPGHRAPLAIDASCGPGRGAWVVRHHPRVITPIAHTPSLSPSRLRGGRAGERGCRTRRTPGTKNFVLRPSKKAIG